MTMTEELMFVEARDKFDRIGIQLQFSARNLNQAIKSYNSSCNRCTMFNRGCIGHQCSIEKAFIHNTHRFHEEMADPEIRTQVENALELDA